MMKRSVRQETIMKQRLRQKTLMKNSFKRTGNYDKTKFLIQSARVSSHVDDFKNTRNKVLTVKLLKQGYRYHKLRKAFSKFYRRHFNIVSNVGLKTLLLQGLSEPEFYGDLVYKFRK